VGWNNGKEIPINAIRSTLVVVKQEAKTTAYLPKASWCSILRKAGGRSGKDERKENEIEDLKDDVIVTVGRSSLRPPGRLPFTSN
jgi:hypothetical protein